MTVTRIPLDIVSTATGHVTTDVLVGVLASDLDALEHHDRLRSALGELIDALSDEVRYEVSQSTHVLDKIDNACRLLGGPYEGYVGSWP